MSEVILLGDEAVARGAIDAGISAAFAYPGTPSTEIYQTVEEHAKKHHLKVRGMWSTNEKVALEEAVGVSYAGCRVMVSMKHVGLNVAADPFMNVAVSGAHGGLVLVVADDPGMHSSQNEQDSRYFADFAMVPCFEPADQQQCYDFTREAFELSEKLQVPVLLRLVTRLAHSRARVKLAAPHEQNAAHFVEDPTRFILLPTNARRAYGQLIDKQASLQDYAQALPVNALTLRGGKRAGILVSGLAWNYLQEALGEQLQDYNLLRIGFYPLPVPKIRQLLDASSEIWVVEEGYPFIERYVSALGLMTERTVRGKLSGDLPRTGELSQDAIKRCFGLPVSRSLTLPGLADVLVGRPPSLCDKCPHTDSYLAINEVIAEFNPGARIMGDIGCYTLGAVGPLQGIHSCLCMGASIGMAIGVVHAGMGQAICVIGDGTFTHSGMAPLLDAARDNTNIKVFILDNSIIAMTGGQPTAATDEEVVNLVAGLGVPREHIRIVVPSPHKKHHTMETIREELAYTGLSVIIARRACVTYAKEIKEIKETREEKRHIKMVSA
ncbi:thiamine pyrophosphate-dependent enzyme [Rhodoferax sp.]|uniref:thiamine pyrophosphate-dependent enzyme n=1 Tax=Rhodoferax sp. TaxID=50421 RepID=UPI001A06DA9E|nr:thiamine pyrophosphate-dependent enzyme [Rhodoferax sp.]MBE0473374.1 indolepyruvate ferredoxin oxidoreductase [Rhodoferax sp.]